MGANGAEESDSMGNEDSESEDPEAIEEPGDLLSFPPSPSRCSGAGIACFFCHPPTPLFLLSRPHHIDKESVGWRRRHREQLGCCAWKLFSKSTLPTYKHVDGRRVL